MITFSDFFIMLCLKHGLLENEILTVITQSLRLKSIQHQNIKIAARVVLHLAIFNNNFSPGKYSKSMESGGRFWLAGRVSMNRAAHGSVWWVVVSERKVAVVCMHGGFPCNEERQRERNFFLSHLFQILQSKTTQVNFYTFCVLTSLCIWKNQLKMLLKSTHNIKYKY